MRAEAGQLDPARALVAELLERAEQCLVDAGVLLDCAHPDQTALSAQIETMTGFVDLWRSLGLNAYQTHYDCSLGQLLTAADRRDEARARIATALQLAEETGMHP